jgi:hypothetical protein
MNGWALTHTFSPPAQPRGCNFTRPRLTSADTTQKEIA